MQSHNPFGVHNFNATISLLDELSALFPVPHKHQIQLEKHFKYKFRGQAVDLQWQPASFG